MKTSRPSAENVNETPALSHEYRKPLPGFRLVYILLCHQPKGGLDFAAELAAKIGVVPVKKQDSDDDDDEKVADGEWSDEEHQEPQTPEVQEKQLHSTTKSRSDTSRSKEKKSHHHHHEKKDRSESHGEHKHRKRRGSKTSHTSRSSVDTRKSVPAEDGEKKQHFYVYF